MREQLPKARRPLGEEHEEAYVSAPPRCPCHASQRSSRRELTKPDDLQRARSDATADLGAAAPSRSDSSGLSTTRTRLAHSTMRGVSPRRQRLRASARLRVHDAMAWTTGTVPSSARGPPSSAPYQASGSIQETSDDRGRPSGRRDLCQPTAPTGAAAAPELCVSSHPPKPPNLPNNLRGRPIP